jgi:hypothetical protein
MPVDVQSLSAEEYEEFRRKRKQAVREWRQRDSNAEVERRRGRKSAKVTAVANRMLRANHDEEFEKALELNRAIARKQIVGNQEPNSKLSVKVYGRALAQTELAFRHQYYDEYKALLKEIGKAYDAGENVNLMVPVRKPKPRPIGNKRFVAESRKELLSLYDKLVDGEIQPSVFIRQASRIANETHERVTR